MEKKLLHIGTSGFSYDDWLGNFYPQFCPKLDMLQFYSSKFKIVEIDSTYYRIPSETTIKKWSKVTPDCFKFTAKFPKTVTHEGNIDQRLETADLFINTMKLLQDKLAVLLLQFPYNFKPDQIDILFQIVKLLPSDIRFALEIRNKCWLQEKKLFRLLQDQNIAFCLIDHPWMPKVDIQTADFSYFRFLGDRKKIEKDFSFERNKRETELSYWKNVITNRLDTNKECFVFFNNHYSGHSPSTAASFKEQIKTL